MKKREKLPKYKQASKQSAKYFNSYIATKFKFEEVFEPDFLLLA